MAAYRRVYDSRHLQADCQEPVIEYGLPFTFYFSRLELLKDCLDFSEDLKASKLCLVCCRKQSIVSIPVQLAVMQYQLLRPALATDFCTFTSVTFYARR